MLNLPNQPTESNHHSTQTASINNLQPTAAGKRNSSAKRVPAEPLLPLPLDAPMLLRPGQPIRTPNLTTPSASHRPMGHKQDKSTHRLHKSTRTATLSSASLSPTRSDASVEVFNLPPMAQTVADASSSTTAAESLSPEVSTSGNLLGQDTSVYQQLRSTPSVTFYPFIFYPILPFQPPTILPLPPHHIQSLHRQPAPGRMFRQEGPKSTYFASC